MNSRRIALWAALAAATCWAAKSVAIGVAGGLDKSPAEGLFFLAGLVTFVVAVVALGVSVGRGPRWMRILAGVGAFIGGLALTLVVDAVVGSFTGATRHWVWTELNLWVAALAVLAGALALNRVRQPRGALA